MVAASAAGIRMAANALAASEGSASSKNSKKKSLKANLEARSGFSRSVKRIVTSVKKIGPEAGAPSPGFIRHLGHARSSSRRRRHHAQPSSPSHAPIDGKRLGRLMRQIACFAGTADVRVARRQGRCAGWRTCGIPDVAHAPYEMV